MLNSLCFVTKLVQSSKLTAEIKVELEKKSVMKSSKESKMKEKYIPLVNRRFVMQVDRTRMMVNSITKEFIGVIPNKIKRALAEHINSNRCCCYFH